MRRFFAMLRSPGQQEPSKVLSESEIRLLNREQLVKYALELSQKRPISISSPPPPDVDAERTDKSLSTTINNGERARKKRKRKPREFDWAKYGVRSIALRLSYLGWDYHGFASQPHSENTVEHHLFTALQKTYLVRSRASCGYSRAGRTDVGVSARTQVVGVTVRSNLMRPSCGAREFEYARMLNAVLPHEIRVTGWAPVAEKDDCDNIAIKRHPADPPEISRALDAVYGISDTSEVRRPGAEFSARFDASWRAYKYHFIPDGLDIEAMKAACRNFVGRHSFINFCKIDENVRNFERLMYDVDIVQNANSNSGECYVYVRGQAFLWHQVRCMVAILFEVGTGNESPDIVTRMLEGARPFDEGKPAYRMASPIPLVLDECHYPKAVLQFPEPPRNTRGDGVTAKIYAQHALKASVIRGFMDANDNSNRNDDDENGTSRANYILDSRINRTKYTRLEDRTMEKRKTYYTTNKQ